MRILIVDDDEQVVSVLLAGAESFGCERIDSAESGEEALGLAIQNSYDLVTLDVRMSGVSGLQAMSVIRGLRPHCIVAIVSAYVEDLSDEDLYAADVVIRKPIELSTYRQLLTLTQEIEDRRDAIRQLSS